MFVIEVKDDGVHAAISALAGRVANTKPLLQQIGEMVMERSKQRFQTSTGPDGRRWAPNSRVTIERFIASRGGVGKRGKITSNGSGLAMSKKPLIGESKDLSHQFHVSADATSVTIGNSAIYAAVQQFGAKMGEFGRYSQVKRWRDYGEKDFRRYAGTKKGFPIPWGNIPARPFLPVTQNGELYPAERAAILDTLSDFLAGRGFAK